MSAYSEKGALTFALLSVKTFERPEVVLSNEPSTIKVAAPKEHELM